MQLKMSYTGVLDAYRCDIVPHLREKPDSLLAENGARRSSR